MSINRFKKNAAQAALKLVLPKLEQNTIIGIGTGSTANYFIDLLAEHKHNFDGCVASSFASAERLKILGIPVYDLNSVSILPFYIDGADEITEHLQAIKGGGAALTREKIIAAFAVDFICIADESKLVSTLGAFPLPIEVIPMARGYVARAISALGGNPQYREDVITDNGNIILDIWNLDISRPVALEKQLNNITGVVTNGIFAIRPANVLFLAGQTGVHTFYSK